MVHHFNDLVSNLRVRLFVTGKVQGVFFRQSLKVMAKKNDVFGWVRNLQDGRVEAILEGNEAKVHMLIEWAHTGPANSRVEDVNVQNEKFLAEFSKFNVLY